MTYVYDAAGNRTQTIVNGVKENYSTNNLNQYQITKETKNDGTIIEYEYGATDGLLTSVSDNSSGSITQFNFNQAENKISIEYANASIRNLRLYSFDELDRRTQIEIQDAENTYTYSYDLDGNLTSKTEGGQEIAYEYNNNYQVTKEIHSDGKIIEYEYGANVGFITSISDGSSGIITQFNYNQAENKLSIVDSGGFIRDYIFDNLGRKAQIAIQDGTNTYTTNYNYDSLGRLDQLTDGDRNLIVDYDYHPVSGQLVKETNGNGTDTSYSYDLAGQLISLVNSQADGTANSRFDYTYDNLGRRTEVGTLDGTWNYEYDLSGQLTGAVFASNNPDIESQDLTYVYDAAGNRTQTIVNGVTENYSTNNLNQYQITKETQSDGSILTYEYGEHNGLLTSIRNNNRENNTQIKYNEAKNELSIIHPSGFMHDYKFDDLGRKDQIAIQDAENTYSYDLDGNLTSKIKSKQIAKVNF